MPSSLTLSEMWTGQSFLKVLHIHKIMTNCSSTYWQHANINVFSLPVECQGLGFLSWGGTWTVLYFFGGGGGGGEVVPYHGEGLGVRYRFGGGGGRGGA